jgi:hypothetical protein
VVRARHAKYRIRAAVYHCRMSAPMSALGQERRFAMSAVTSAFPDN